jgi:hypothetical protein
MADITNQQIVVWSNTRARTLADRLAALYPVIQAYVTDYAAQGIGALIIAAGSSNNVSDSVGGPGADGRSIVTGTTIGPNFLACVNALKTVLDTTAVVGVGTPVNNTVNQIQVNGTPR